MTSWNLLTNKSENKKRAFLKSNLFYKKSSSIGDEDMAYQSEAALEQQFIEQLNKQGYTSVSIPNYDALGASVQHYAWKICFPERKNT